MTDRSEDAPLDQQREMWRLIASEEQKAKDAAVREAQRLQSYIDLRNEADETMVAGFTSTIHDLEAEVAFWRSKTYEVCCGAQDDPDEYDIVLDHQAGMATRHGRDVPPW